MITAKWKQLFHKTSCHNELRGKKDSKIHLFEEKHKKRKSEK